MNDFVTIGMEGTPKCEANLRSMEHVCKELGTPVEPNKSSHQVHSGDGARLKG